MRGDIMSSFLSSVYYSNLLFPHAAVCSPQCKNGGTCVAPEQCHCTPGWSGDHCNDGMHMHKFNHANIQ